MQLADLLVPCHPSEAINSSWDTELGERKKKKKGKKPKQNQKNPNQTKPEKRTLNRSKTRHLTRKGVIKIHYLQL